MIAIQTEQAARDEPVDDTRSRNGTSFAADDSDLPVVGPGNHCFRLVTAPTVEPGSCRRTRRQWRSASLPRVMAGWPHPSLPKSRSNRGEVDDTSGRLPTVSTRNWPGLHATVGGYQTIQRLQWDVSSPAVRSTEWLSQFDPYRSRATWKSRPRRCQ
jgi:hypothetical protein